MRRVRRESFESLIGVLTGLLVASGAGLLAADAPDGPAPSAVTGDYVEARTCDVWTGPCFSMGEINVKGTRAVLGWKVGRGTYGGARLDGLAVAVVVTSEGTLTTDSEGKSRSVVFVDERATAEQEKALLGLAKELAPRYLKDVVAVHRTRIALDRKALRARLEVGEKAEAKVETTALDPHRDVICGNESRTYPALSKATSVDCAKTLDHAYRGKDLGVTWAEPNARSAMVGTFAL